MLERFRLCNLSRHCRLRSTSTELARDKKQRQQCVTILFLDDTTHTFRIEVSFQFLKKFYKNLHLSFSFSIYFTYINYNCLMFTLFCLFICFRGKFQFCKYLNNNEFYLFSFMHLYLFFVVLSSFIICIKIICI